MGVDSTKKTGHIGDEHEKDHEKKQQLDSGYFSPGDCRQCFPFNNGKADERPSCSNSGRQQLLESGRKMVLNWALDRGAIYRRRRSLSDPCIYKPYESSRMVSIETQTDWDDTLTTTIDAVADWPAMRTFPLGANGQVAISIGNRLRRIGDQFDDSPHSAVTVIYQDPFVVLRMMIAVRWRNLLPLWAQNVTSAIGAIVFRFVGQ